MLPKREKLRTKGTDNQFSRYLLSLFQHNVQSHSRNRGRNTLEDFWSKRFDISLWSLICNDACCKQWPTAVGNVCARFCHDRAHVHIAWKTTTCACATVKSRFLLPWRQCHLSVQTSTLNVYNANNGAGVRFYVQTDILTLNYAHVYSSRWHTALQRLQNAVTMLYHQAMPWFSCSDFQTQFHNTNSTQNRHRVLDSSVNNSGSFQTHKGALTCCSKWSVLLKTNVLIFFCTSQQVQEPG